MYMYICTHIHIHSFIHKYIRIYYIPANLSKPETLRVRLTKACIRYIAIWKVEPKAISNLDEAQQVKCARVQQPFELHTIWQRQLGELQFAIEREIKRPNVYFLSFYAAFIAIYFLSEYDCILMSDIN